ncbi:MAG: efflux RND transporter periplasmic adaptor subunit [Opitutales bacterium]
MKTTFLLPLLPLFLLVGCSRPEAAAPPVALPPVQVRLASVQVAEFPELTELTGTVRPVRRAVLAAKVAGAITELTVTLGQPVRNDDVLVRLASAEATARVAQARAQLSVVTRDLRRERELLARDASTTETVRNLQDQVAAGEAAVREAEAQLAYTVIRAPFDGVIARRPVNVGDLATPGQPLLEIEGASDFEIEAGVPASLAAALTPRATFACTVGEETFAGRLRETSSAIDDATRTIGVKLAVPAGATVRSGQFARIQIPGRLVATLLVPATAVSLQGQMERVFVAGDGNRAGLHLVKTGAPRGDRVEIVSGLTAGDRVVVAAPAGLREGQLLETAP